MFRVFRIVSRYTAPDKTSMDTRNITGWFSSGISIENSGDLYQIKAKSPIRTIPDRMIIIFKVPST